VVFGQLVAKALHAQELVEILWRIDHI
jgi:hypothetical protein